MKRYEEWLSSRENRLNEIWGTALAATALAGASAAAGAKVNQWWQNRKQDKNTPAGPQAIDYDVPNTTLDPVVEKFFQAIKGPTTSNLHKHFLVKKDGTGGYKPVEVKETESIISELRRWAAAKMYGWQLAPQVAQEILMWLNSVYTSNERTDQPAGQPFTSDGVSLRQKIGDLNSFSSWWDANIGGTKKVGGGGAMGIGWNRENEKYKQNVANANAPVNLSTLQNLTPANLATIRGGLKKALSNPTDAQAMKVVKYLATIFGAGP